MKRTSFKARDSKTTGLRTPALKTLDLNRIAISGKLAQTISMLIFLCMFAGCVFKFEVPSAKTKLEKQVLGYKPVVSKKDLLNIVTRSDFPNDSTKDQLRQLRENLKEQIIRSLKQGVFGEAYNGELAVLSEDKRRVSLSASELVTMQELAADENFSRKKLGEISGSPASDYAYRAVDGAWYESSDQTWQQNNR